MRTYPNQLANLADKELQDILKRSVEKAGSPNKLSKWIGCKSSTVHAWIKGQARPSKDYLRYLKDFLEDDERKLELDRIPW